MDGEFAGPKTHPLHNRIKMERIKLPITLVAIVHNSNGRIKDFIEYHRDIVSEVVIVDQDSTDGTYEDALESADLVVRRRCKGTADPDRNFAFQLGSQPWVLYLDDDEKVSEALKDIMPKLIESKSDVFWIERQNFVDDVNISELMGKDYQCRLFKRGTLNFPDEIHKFPERASNCFATYVSQCILHNRTLNGLIAANKAREVIASPQAIELQNNFVEAVKKFMAEHNGFTDNWYSAEQLQSLVKAYDLTKGLTGFIIEIGCWEGKSTCALANAAYPESVLAVDTWEGNIAEGADHPSVLKAKLRDVKSEFDNNVYNRTKGNVFPHKRDCFDFLESFNDPIKFCHIDAAHDYDSVARTIKLIKHDLVPGGVICGDDFISAGASRTDLNGGVERAVREQCPGFKSVDNFWYWVS
jgi:SAM-dependent methyltransferase